MTRHTPPPARRCCLKKPADCREESDTPHKTERRCTYNRQLSRPECHDVHVSHTHTDNTPEGRNGDSDGPRNGGIHTPATTAPPPATAPRQCPAGTHRYGNGCHSHSFTPPCGTGTWTPHAGHTAKQRLPCPPPPKCPDGQTGTPPNCTEPNKNSKGGGGSGGTTTTDDSPRKCDGSEWHQNFWHQHGSSGCHQTGTKHCPDGQHEHVHGSQQCHTLGKSAKNASGTHSGWTDHCAAGHHSHEHNGSCHAADPPYHENMEEGVEITRIEYPPGYICYITETIAHGETKNCAQIPVDEDDGVLSKEQEARLLKLGIDAGTLRLCVLAGPAALKCGGLVIAASLIGEILCLVVCRGFGCAASQPSDLGKCVAVPRKQSADTPLEPFCVKEDEDPGPPTRQVGAQKPPTDETDDDSGTDDQDGGDSTDDDSDTDDEGDDDSGDGQPKITRAEVQKAIADYRAGLITAEEMRKISNGWACQQYGGHYCRYAQ